MLPAAEGEVLIFVVTGGEFGPVSELLLLASVKNFHYNIYSICSCFKLNKKKNENNVRIKANDLLASADFFLSVVINL